MAANIIGMAFVPYYRHIMKILETDTKLRKTVNGIMKQVSWSAGCTLVGGIFGGPVGAAVGGVVGAAIGYRLTDEYDSLVSVLKNMDEEHQQLLVIRVQEIVGSTGLEALTQFVAGQVNRELFATLIRDFVTELKSGG